MPAGQRGGVTLAPARARSECLRGCQYAEQRRANRRTGVRPPAISSSPDRANARQLAMMNVAQL